LQEFQTPEDGLIVQLVAFNLGVEIGQFAALVFILIAINRDAAKLPSFQKFFHFDQYLLMSGGLMLMAYQLTRFCYQFLNLRRRICNNTVSSKKTLIKPAVSATVVAYCRCVITLICLRSFTILIPQVFGQQVGLTGSCHKHLRLMTPTNHNK